MIKLKLWYRDLWQNTLCHMKLSPTLLYLTRNCHVILKLWPVWTWTGLMPHIRCVWMGKVIREKRVGNWTPHSFLSSNLENVLAVLVNSYSVTSGKVELRHLTWTSVTQVDSQALYDLSCSCLPNSICLGLMCVDTDGVWCCHERFKIRTGNFDNQNLAPQLLDIVGDTACPQCQQEVLCSILENSFLAAITPQWL